jgi:hypothetical protein
MPAITRSQTKCANVPMPISMVTSSVKTKPNKNQKSKIKNQKSKIKNQKSKNNKTKSVYYYFFY